MPEPLDIQKCVRNLREVELFRSLDEERLTSVARICEFITLEPGSHLIHEGSEALDIYILLMGEVSVSKVLKLPHLSAVEGAHRILNTLTAEGHPVLGETAILGHALRRATVRCGSECTLYRIDADDLKSLLTDDPVIGSCVYRHLSEMLHDRLESANTDVVKLSAALVFALES